MGLYRDNTGAIVEIDDAFANTQGYEPVGDDYNTGRLLEEGRVESLDRGIIGQIGAGASGIASGLTLGASDLLLGGLLDDSQQRVLQGDLETNPGTRLAGEIGGGVLGALSGAPSPVGSLSRAAGETVEQGIAQGGAAGTAKALGAMGTEGAIQSAGSYIGSTAIADKEATVEGFAGALAVGGAFGAAGGGAALGVSKGTIAARKLYARYADGAQAADDAAINFEKIARERLDVDEASLRAAQSKVDDIRKAKLEADIARARAKADVRRTTMQAEEAAAREAGREPFVPTYTEPGLDVVRGPEMPDWMKRRRDGTEPPGAAGEKYGPYQEYGPVDSEPWRLYRRGKIGDEVGVGKAEKYGPISGRDKTQKIPRPDNLNAKPQSEGTVVLPRSTLRTTPDTSIVPIADTIPDTGIVSTVDVKDLYGKEWTTTPGVGKDKVKMGKARQAMSEGQIDPVVIAVAPDGKLDIVDGRHRLQAAFESGSSVKIKWERGVGGANVSPSPESLIGKLDDAAPKTIDEALAAEREASMGVLDDIRAAREAKPYASSSKAEPPSGTLSMSTKNEPIIPDWLAEEAAYRASKGMVDPKLGDMSDLAEVLGDDMAKQFSELEEALLEFSRSRSELSIFSDEGIAFQKFSRGQDVPDDFRARDLDNAADDARERMLRSETDEERSLALSESDGFESQLENLQGPAEFRTKKSFAEEIAEESLAITRYEKASARLNELLGDAAPPLGLESGKMFSEAAEEATRKATDRVMRAAEDSDFNMPGELEDLLPEYGPYQEYGPKFDPKADVKFAKDKYRASKDDYDRYVIDEKVAKSEAKTAKQTLADGKKAFKEQFTKKPSTGKVGAAEGVGVLEMMDIPGMPSVSDLPVIGPFLGAYLKFRVAKAAMGRMAGRIPATADAKVAALAARTRDRIAKAVDRSLNLAETGAKATRFAAPKLAKIVAPRIYDDGQPDVEKGASIAATVAVRTRELAAYVSTPGAIEADVRKQMAGVTDPDLIAQAEKHRRMAMEYLLQNAPKLPTPGPLSKHKFLPSAGAAMSFARRVQAVNDPVSVFEQIDNERALLSLEMAQTLRAVYPTLFMQAQTRMMMKAAEIKQTVPYRTRIQMSLLYDVPLDASMDPDNMKILQSSYAKPAPAPMPGVAAPPVPSVAGQTNMTALFQSTADRRAAR